MIKKIFELDVSNYDETFTRFYFFGINEVKLKKVFIVEGEIEIFESDSKKLSVILFADELDGSCLEKASTIFSYRNTGKNILINKPIYHAFPFYVTDFMEIKQEEFNTINETVNKMLLLPIGVNGEEVSNTIEYLEFATEIRTLCNLDGKLISK